MKRGLTIGLDIGGTKIQSGLVTANGRIVARYRAATPTKGGAKALMTEIEKALVEVWTPRVKSIGIGIAGLVDAKKGVFLGGPNLPPSFRNIPLAARLKRRYKVPVRVDNDARCFTLGEARFGAAKGQKNVIGLTIGTGIGGGLVMNGQIIRGRDNSAGEVGHLTLDLCSPCVCGCGQSGHLEALASGTAIAGYYRQLTGRRIPAREVEERSRRGEKAAAKAVETAGAWLGLGIANLALVLDPDMIVIGGGASRSRLLWPALRRTFRGSVLYPRLRTIPIVRAELGDDANLVGAASLA